MARLPADFGRGGWLFLRYGASALVGAIALVIAGQRYRIDQLRCVSWPPASTGALYGALFALALLLLSVGWLGITGLCLGRTLPVGSSSELLPPDERPSFRRVMLFGALLHGLALFAPPFLSDDPLAYAAIGRAMHLYHQGMYVPLGVSLPLTDPVRRAIEQMPSWLAVGSAYAPGFNWLASSLVRIAGEDVLLTLRLFQRLGMITSLLSAAAVGYAAQLQAQGGGHGEAGEDPESAAARAAALVLLCPLTLIEATVGAHNDNLLMLSVALCVLAVIKQRPLAALAWLALGLLVKASALLLVLLFGCHLVAARLRLRVPRRGRTVFIVAALLAVMAMTLLLWKVQPWLMRYLSTVARLLGSPSDSLPYCTHSLECLPRAILHVLLGMKTASWLLGIAFRGMAVAFLLYMVLREERGQRYLSVSASFVFFYYLYLHASSQPWYLLSLVPLLPFAERRLLPAMLSFALASLSHYVMDFSFSCDRTVSGVGFSELVEGLMFLVPPTVVLLRSRRRDPAV